jgi:hypothetical protein
VWPGMAAVAAAADTTKITATQLWHTQNFHRVQHWWLWLSKRGHFPAFRAVCQRYVDMLCRLLASVYLQEDNFDLVNVDSFGSDTSSQHLMPSLILRPLRTARVLSAVQVVCICVPAEGLL